MTEDSSFLIYFVAEGALYKIYNTALCQNKSYNVFVLKTLTATE